MSQMQSGLSGLGSLVGIDLSLQQDNSFALYSEAAYSLAVSEKLAQDSDIQQSVFPEAWNDRARRWDEPRSSLRSVVRGLKRAVGVPVPAWHPPGAAELNQYIRDQVEIAEDKRKPVLRLSFAHKDPKFARRLLEELHAEVDNFMRRKSLVRTSEYIAYLETRLRQITVSEYREALAQTLGGYEKTRMLASSPTAFAADKLGGTIVSTEPTSPQPAMVLALGALAGIALWFAIAWVVTLRQ